MSDSSNKINPSYKTHMAAAAAAAEGEWSCPICTLGEDVKQKCSVNCAGRHSYHLKCLQEWCQTQQMQAGCICPICRQPITSITCNGVTHPVIQAAVYGEDLETYAFTGNLDAVNALIADGADVNAPNQWGRTPLMTAAYYGHLDVVEALRHAGASVLNVQPISGWDPLIFAAHSHTDNPAIVVALLTTGGVNVNRRDANEWMPLMFAASRGHVNVVNVLIANDAAVNATKADGWTAIFLAAHDGHINVVNALIAAGANVNVDDGGGLTPLMIASRRGPIAVVNALIPRTAHLNAVDRFGQTALMYAVRREGDVDIVKALIAAGADTQGVTLNYGHTAEMRAVLEAAGVRPLPPAGAARAGPYLVDDASSDEDLRGGAAAYFGIKL